MATCENMTQEEKAKRYDEAIKKAESLYKASEPMSGCNVIVETLFPELKESDDERIRKAISQCVEDMRGQFEKLYSVHHKDALAYLEKQSEHANFRNKIQIGDKVTRNRDGVLVNLSQLNRVAKKDEKQGEQKSANKTEPKFKNGQWIVWQDKCYKVNYNDCGYELVDQDGLNTSLEYGTIDENAYLWTIKDAKDGDVLATDDGNIFVFDGTVEEGKYPFAYYGLTRRRFESYDRRLPFTHNNVHPATKEQRDLLFQKMKEAGYTWDAKKKELKKIEQKSAWSEKDETTKNNISHIIRQYDKISKRENQPCWYVGDCLLWMQNIKDRVQPQQEWSEEDESMWAEISDLLWEGYKQSGSKFSWDDIRNWINPKLKSLRHQNRWKPSDEQMEILNMVLTNEIMDDNIARILRELREQLKKLKEE